HHGLVPRRRLHPADADLPQHLLPFRVRQVGRRHHHIGARAGHLRRDHHRVPDLRAARLRAALATHQGEVAALAVQPLRRMSSVHNKKVTNQGRVRVMITDTILRRAIPGIFALGTAVAVAAASSAAMAQQEQPEQYFGIPSSRVGPYSAMGTGYYGGIIDYLNYVNMKFGGVNGVKLTYDECETEYNAARTVECYQRLLNKGDQKMVVFDTLGTPGAYAGIGRMAPDQVVLAQYGYGRTDAAHGRVWPWGFNSAD